MAMKSLLFIAMLLLALLLVSCFKGGNAITTGSVVDLEQAAPSSQAACSDTDGKDTAVKGTVSGVYEDGTVFEFSDGCHAGFLVEYYCDGNHLENMNVRCPVRCNTGVCVSE